MSTQNIRNYRCQSVGGDDIELNISDLDLNTTEITISNLNYKGNRIAAIKYILLSSLLLGGILVFKSIILNIVLIVFISIQLYCFTCLVESGKNFHDCVRHERKHKFQNFYFRRKIDRNQRLWCTNDNSSSSWPDKQHVHSVCSHS